MVCFREQCSHWLVHRKNRRTTDTYGRSLDRSDSSMLSWNQNDLGFLEKDKADFCEKAPLKIKTLLAMAVATSIDALATGVILPSAVGAETLIQNDMFHFIHFRYYIYPLFHRCFLGKKFGCLLHNKSTILGVIVLICIGIKIFVEQVFFKYPSIVSLFFKN